MPFRDLGSGACLLGFKPQLHHCLAAGHDSSRPSFLFCKMRIITMTASCACREDSAKLIHSVSLGHDWQIVGA